MSSHSIGDGMARVDAKLWEDGTAEPTEYDLTHDFPRQQGSIAIMAKYCDVTFGDITVTPLVPAAHALTTAAIGNGSITLSPDYDLYPDSTVVLVTAVPDPGYSFVGWSDGLSGRANPDTVLMLSDTTVTATFVEGTQSDDFYASALNTSLWRFIDPLGDATLTMTGTNLTVYIPGGMDHSLTTTGNNAPRIMQDAPDGNFEVEAKFDSRGSYTYQGQGILVQEDDDTYLRFDLVYTSSGTQVYIGYFDAGVLTAVSNTTPAVQPTCLKVSREADTWTLKYSTNGTSWTTQKIFQQPLAVTEVGVFFNNTGSLWKTPAFVGNVDYFFNTSQPIIPEDDGSPSAATPPVVNLWYGDNQSFGDLGVPQTWVNLLGNVWDSDSVVTLSYRLNKGPSSPLSMGPDGKRLIGVGDFNAEIDYNELVPGENSIVITAIDELGEQTDHVVTLDYTPGITWEIPYTADWASAAEVTDVAHVGDGRWAISPEGVRTDVGGIGYDRFLVIGDYHWMSDYEVVLPMTIHMGNPLGGAGVGLAIGWQGHIGSSLPGADFVQPQLENRYQAIGWIRNIPDNTILQLKDDELTRGEVNLDMLEGVRYILKMRSEHIAPGHAQVSVKIWEDGTAEPAGWHLTDDFAPRDGSVALIAHQADVTFGSASITPLGSFPLHTLNVDISGNGTVTPVPDYTAYPDSAQVQLTAHAEDGWFFVNWTGGVTSTNNPLSIIMRSDTSITANFAEVPYTITRNVVGSGSIGLNPDRVAYAPGDTVIVTAYPNAGWAFSSWSDGLTGIENPDTIVVVSDTTITANFVQGAFTVDVVIAGNGAVTVEPLKASYMPGDTITLAAEPDSGYYFYGWSGDHDGGASPDTMTVDADMRIIATFFATITGIDAPPSIRTLTVLQNSPNPFTRHTYLQFGLPEPTGVEINVYDVAGRRVFSDHVSGASAGWNSFMFDGRDRSGKPLPSGVYFYQVRTPNKAVTKKLVIVR
ncbi:MAG: T9SS type A sorting domain-containing protein [bacterium]